MLRHSPLFLAILTALVCLAGAASADPATTPARPDAPWHQVLAQAGHLPAQSMPGGFTPLHSAVGLEAGAVTAFVPSTSGTPRGMWPARR